MDVVGSLPPVPAPLELEPVETEPLDALGAPDEACDAEVDASPPTPEVVEEPSSPQAARANTSDESHTPPGVRNDIGHP